MVGIVVLIVTIAMAVWIYQAGISQRDFKSLAAYGCSVSIDLGGHSQHCYHVPQCRR